MKALKTLGVVEVTVVRRLKVSVVVVASVVKRSGIDCCGEF